MLRTKIQHLAGAGRPLTQHAKMNQTDGNENVIKAKSKRLTDKFDHLIPQVRDKLRDKLTNEDAFKDTFYQRDLDDAMKHDFRVRRHLVKQNGSVSATVDSMISRFQFIKQNKLREIDDSHIPREFHLLGCLFIYEKDLQGRPTVYNRLKLNVPSSELLPMKKVSFAYQFLKADDAAGEDGIVTISDVADTPWSALETSMVKYLSEVNKFFPYTIAEALIINLPMFGQMFFSLIKYTFPSETRPKCVSLDQVVDCIGVNNLPLFLGGKCKKPYCGPASMPLDCIALSEHLKNHGTSEKRIQEIYSSSEKLLEMVAKEGGWWSEDLIERVKQGRELTEPWWRCFSNNQQLRDMIKWLHWWHQTK